MIYQLHPQPKVWYSDGSNINFFVDRYYFSIIRENYSPRLTKIIAPILLAGSEPTEAELEQWKYAYTKWWKTHPKAWSYDIQVQKWADGKWRRIEIKRESP